MTKGDGAQSCIQNSELSAQLFASSKFNRGNWGFVRLGYVTKIKKELAAYKRFKKLTQDCVALAITLSQLRIEEARQNEDGK